VSEHASLGAVVPEGDDPAREDAERNVVARDADRCYLHDVQHDGTTLRTAGVGDQLGCESVLHGSYSRSVRNLPCPANYSGPGFDAGSEAADVRSEDFTEREALRQGRLRRWQAIR
jgi:hypothetical protein